MTLVCCVTIKEIINPVSETLYVEIAHCYEKSSHSSFLKGKSLVRFLKFVDIISDFYIEYLSFNLARLNWAQSPKFDATYELEQNIQIKNI
jgi:hypothetical protein